MSRLSTFALGALAAISLAGCAGSPEPREERPLTLTITSPEYGAFLQDGPIEVVGTVSDAAATVLVEGVEVPVAGDGTFRTTLELAGDYEVVDVRAGGDSLADVRERVPVFSGNKPSETWVNAMPGRMTNEGLLRLGAGLGAQIDETGWAEGLLGALQPIDTNLVKLTPKEVRHSPTQVVIEGVEGGLRIGIELRDVAIVTEATYEVFGFSRTSELVIGYDTITITLLATPSIRADGIVVLTVDDSEIDFAKPNFMLDGSALSGLEFLADAAGLLMEPAGQWLLDQMLGVLGEIELGGPFEFETDVGGTPLYIELRDVAGDPEGLPFLMGVGLGETVPDTLPPVPTPSESARVPEPVHLVMGTHEYLLDELVGTQIDGALSGDLDIGAFSSVIGSLLGNLPGGGTAPEGEWCVAITPGPARVVRLHDGIAPLGHLYLPDVDVEFAVDQGSGCEPWLVANLAMEIAIVPKGTEIGADISVGDAAIMYYGAHPDLWTETEVVVGVKDLVGTLADVAAGRLSIDLAELFAGMEEQEGLAGAIGPLEPRILDSEPMAVEGMVALSLGLWPEE